MKKVLMLASVASMIDQFNMENIKILQGLGYQVHVAANFEYGNTSSKQRIEAFKRELEMLQIPYYQVEFARNITKVFQNIRALRQIIDLMKIHTYEFVHCHSPIGGVCGRIAAYYTRTKVIYTAHGFHFFKGSPLKNWLMYYPVEWFLARYTDVLITINKEDYQYAKNRFAARKIHYVPGVGVDVDKFGNINVDKSKKRVELGIESDTVVLLSVGELIKRKNHETIISAIAGLEKIKLLYLICGKGVLDESLKKMVLTLGLEERVRFLGFRTDISEICAAADIYVFPSYQEGLPLALMEAMAGGLPVACSAIRGNTDLIEHGQGGYLCSPDDVHAFTENIRKLAEDTITREHMGRKNSVVIKDFSVKTVNGLMREIYADV